MALEPTKAPNRPVRTPLGTRNKLTFKGAKDPNYVYRVVNDKDDRLSDALEGGYQFVTGDDKLGDKSVADGKSVDSRICKSVGGGTKGYLMRVPKDIYDADQAMKMANIAKTEESLKPNRAKGEYGDGVTNV